MGLHGASRAKKSCLETRRHKDEEKLRASARQDLVEGRKIHKCVVVREIWSFGERALSTGHSFKSAETLHYRTIGG